MHVSTHVVATNLVNRADPYDCKRHELKMEPQSGQYEQTNRLNKSQIMWYRLAGTLKHKYILN